MHAFASKPPPLHEGPDGVIHVSGTRVSLETVVTAFDEGCTAEEIVQRYPSLELAAVYAVIAYVLGNRREVSDYVAARRGDVLLVRSGVEALSPPHGIRARLLARRPGQQE